MSVDNVINARAVAGAYAGKSSVADTSSSSDSGSSFMDLVKNAAKSSIDTLKNSEKVQAEAISGNASAVEVVEAATSAEITLQAAVSIRDKLVSAYQEVMRMSI